MLSELVVENLGPIARAEIVLQAGSSALTGETGAGKTLLVTAVTLLVGGRADRGIVRDGTDEARVEGRFVVPEGHPAAGLLRARELLDGPTAPVEIVVTRTVTPSGSRARINGRLVPASVLAKIGPLLVEIAGQHEHHRFGSPRVQREILDAVAGTRAVALAAEVAATVKELVRTERELDELRALRRTGGEHVGLGLAAPSSRRGHHPAWYTRVGRGSPAASADVHPSGRRLFVFMSNTAPDPASHRLRDAFHCVAYSS